MEFDQEHKSQQWQTIHKAKQTKNMHTKESANNAAWSTNPDSAQPMAKHVRVLEKLIISYKYAAVQ